MPYTGPAIEDYVALNGIDVLHGEATTIFVCSNPEPNTYSLATTTSALGFKSFGAGNTFGADVAASPNGRSVTSNSCTDGTITTSGTAAWWAVVDEANSRLLAHGTFTASQVVLVGNTFSLGVFSIQVPAQ